MKNVVCSSCIVFAVMLVLVSCSRQPIEEGIFPSPHEITLASTSAGTTSLRDGYRTFDREAILGRVADNARFDTAIDTAKESVSQLLSMSDGELRALIPPAHTKRALMVHRKGCPVHGGGTAVYQPFGIKVDLSYPLRVRCPIGGEVYPNDEFPDDGQGWLDDRPGSPTEGERYYFTGWFNHWFLYSMPRYVKTMAQLWFLTGDDVYSDKASVLIERFMEVYPDIDGKDLTYDGTDWGVYVKMTGTFWEGTVLMDLTRGIELLLPSFDNSFIQDIHDRIYRPAFDAYSAKPASGNWGNLWNTALTKFGTVTGDTDMLNFVLFEHPAAEVPTIDNQFMRDGFPFEASISYASTYQFVAGNVAEAMGENGRWVWDHPHMRESFHAFADLVCLGRFTHFAADAGGLHNNGWTLPVREVRSAYLAYRTPKLACYLLQALEIHGMNETVSLDDLFREPLDMEEVRGKAANLEPPESTLAPLRGFAIMRTGEGDARAALFFDYGFAHAAHSHADRLNINLFAAGREFIPEMGYPEYMDHIAPATGGWTTHTVCHATVEVNEKRQLFSTFGDLHGFVDADGIKYADASCEDAYAHCGVDLYRRALVMIDIPGGAYVVDLFRVRGGDKHDYLFHGPPVDVSIDGLTLPEPSAGTLAGENIPFGHKPDDVRPYDIDNSGYQYLYDVQETAVEKPYGVQWLSEDGTAFTADFVPDENETFILTKGYPRPASKSLPPMPFLVRRRNPVNDTDISQFASVLSVKRAGENTPVIQEVTRIGLTEASDKTAYGISVKHAYGEDVILFATSPDGHVSSADGRYTLNGQLGAASWRNGRLERMTLIGGTDFTVEGNHVQQGTAGVEAVVVQVYDNKVVLDKPIPAETENRVIFIDRLPVRSAYWVERVNGRTVHISPTTWIGRGRVGDIDVDSGVILDGRDIFRLADIQQQPYFEDIRNYYSGARIIPESGGADYRLKTADSRSVTLDTGREISNAARDLPKGSTFLLYDIGPGDRVRTMNVKQVKF